MKKIIFITILIAFISNSYLYAASGRTVILESEGAAVLMRHGTVMDAKKGMECKEGDRILTCSECKLDIGINNLVGVRIIGSGDCSLSHLKIDDMRLVLASGNVIINIPKLPEGSTFEVETPGAITGVRGTQFWGRVEKGAAGNSVTTFAVRQGFVDIINKNTQETIRIKAGEALDLATDGSPPIKRKALEAELAAMAQADQIAVGSIT